MIIVGRSQQGVRVSLLRQPVDAGPVRPNSRKTSCQTGNDAALIVRCFLSEEGEAAAAVTQHGLHGQTPKWTAFRRRFSIIFHHSECSLTGVQAHFHTHAESMKKKMK